MRTQLSVYLLDPFSPIEKAAPDYLFAEAGVYQTGEVQARCCTVEATCGFGGTFSLAAQYVDQRGVGISSTRAK